MHWFAFKYTYSRSDTSVSESPMYPPNRIQIDSFGSHLKYDEPPSNNAVIGNIMRCSIREARSWFKSTLPKQLTSRNLANNREDSQLTQQ